MLRSNAAAFVLATTILLSTPTFAQQIGPNGGMMMGKDGHETELIVGPTDLTVFLHHGGKPEDAKGAKFRAIIQEAGTSTTINFIVDGNKLVAKLAAPLGAGTIVVISGTAADNHLMSSRYVIK